MSLARGGRGVVAALLASLMLVAGCGAEPAAPAAPAGERPASVQKAPDGRVKPVGIRIPKIGAESTLIEVGVGRNLQIEVPPVDQPMQAAWYRLAEVPGEPGPAIILGHVDGRQKPGIFFRLHELSPGDEIFVERADGTTLRFVAERKEQVPKEQFPEEAVYGETDASELRLITCGGAFDQEEHSYTDNVIVYAHLAA
ncbi:class F sortase [Amycolatopsis arida]|uniref:class F sortase n=1 Tax=Amycolatopsis arida TaxID=587909 RepID=UPI001FB86704|nr:class F sortase [Amycolatopsis arida]